MTVLKGSLAAARQDQRKEPAGLGAPALAAGPGWRRSHASRGVCETLSALRCVNSDFLQRAWEVHIHPVSILLSERASGLNRCQGPKSAAPAQSKPPPEELGQRKRS